MANVHGISDFPQPQPQTNNAASNTGNRNQMRDLIFGPFGVFSNAPTISSKEFHFFHLISIFWKFKSAVFVVSVLQICYYLAEVGINVKYAPLEPLDISTSVLRLMGAHNLQLVKQGQVWRLFTSLFVHLNTLHILFNMVFQLTVGFAIEKQYKPHFFVLIYFVTATFGSLLADVVEPLPIKGGASTALFGFLGVLLGECIFYWQHIRSKYAYCMGLGFSLFFAFMLSTMIQGLDLWGHVGGFIGGVLLVFPLNYKEELRPSWFPIGCVASAVGIVAFLSATITLTITNPLPPH